MNERQEIYCHECDRYVQFNIDTSLNGNHVLRCPNCGHEHCRVVTDGVITDGRWDRRNNNWGCGQTYSVSTFSISTSTTSVSSWLSSGIMTASWVSSAAYTTCST